MSANEESLSAAAADAPDAPVRGPALTADDGELATETTTRADGDGSAGAVSCAETDADADSVSVALLSADADTDAVPVPVTVPAIGEADSVRDAATLPVSFGEPDTEFDRRGLTDGFAVDDCDCVAVVRGDVPTVEVAVFVDVIDGDGAALAVMGDAEGDGDVDGLAELDADTDALLVRMTLAELLDDTLGERDATGDFDALRVALGDGEKLSDGRGLGEIDGDDECVRVGRGVSEKERVATPERETDTVTDSVVERNAERDAVIDAVCERENDGDVEDESVALPPLGLDVRVADLRGDAVPDKDDVAQEETEPVKEGNREGDGVSVSVGEDDAEFCTVRVCDGVVENDTDAALDAVGDCRAEKVSEMLLDTLIVMDGDGDGEFEFEYVSDGRELVDADALEDDDRVTVAARAAENVHSRRRSRIAPHWSESIARSSVSTHF